jgi:tetratricopeptide (TPR) repeat protein
MYLKGGQWTMRRRRRKPSNPLTILFLLALIGALLYFNQIVVPTVPAMFEPTRTPTRSPEAFINEAEEFFKTGKLKQAIEAYQQAILVAPANPATYVAMARVQVFDGQYPQALDSAEKALILNPNYSLALAVKGWALDYLKKYSEAQSAVEEAITLDPNSAVAYAYYAEILIDTNDLGNVEKAIEASRKARDLAPNTLEARRGRGYVLWNTSNYQEAIEEYKAAISINDKLWGLHYELGVIYRETGEYDLAVEEMNRAFALNPTNPDIPTDLARTELTAGYYSKAVQYAEQALKLDPSNPKLHGNLGFMLYKEKIDYERSAKELGLYVQGGMTDEGVTVKGLPLKPGETDYYYSVYGLALTQLDRCAEAISIFQLLLQKVAESQDSYYNATQGIGYCQKGPATPAPAVTASP